VIRSWILRVEKVPRAAPSNLGWEAGARPAGAPSQRHERELEGAPAEVFDVVLFIPELEARRSRPRRCAPQKVPWGARGRPMLDKCSAQVEPQARKRARLGGGAGRKGPRAQPARRRATWASSGPRPR